MAIVVVLRFAIDVSYLQIYEIAIVKVSPPLPPSLPPSLSTSVFVLHKIELCALGF